MKNLATSGELNHQATLRVGPLINIPLILKSLGHKPEPILTSAGFQMTQFEDPDTRISFQAGSHLLARCVEVTGCQKFGFLLGQHAEPSHLGIAGFLLTSAPDVNSALNSLRKFLGLHDQGGVVTLNTSGKITLFGYVINQPGAEAVDQIYDLSIVTACSVMRALCGAEWHPDEVLLMRKTPADLTPYKSFFQAPVRFNSDKNVIVFNKRWLKHQIPSADPLLQQHLQKEAEDLQHAQHEDFVVLLQKLLYQCLTSQNCSAANLAIQFGIHERTLHRRLKHYGTSFRHELEQSRFAISRQLLSETNEPLINIALSLGYSHSGAFSRAFKQWSGKTPTQWRKNFLQY